MTLALASALVPLLLAQAPEKVIDIRASRPPAGNTFEALWSLYKRAEAKGDTPAAQNAMREIRKLRIERNVRSLDTVARARVGEGLEALKGGQGEKAEAGFRDATALDPQLPEGYLGLALHSLRKGPLGIVPTIKETIRGTFARLPTMRGRNDVYVLVVVVAFLALFATTFVFAGAMLLRHASLLRHDLEESFGPGRQAIAMGLATAFLLLPAIAFQGYGWLALWWLTLLFVYMGIAERIAALVILLAAVCVGPAARTLELRLMADENPLFWASVRAVEAGPDTRALAALEDAVRQDAEDRDLQYLLATEYKKSGLYEDAAAAYREVLRKEPNDLVALNNLANLEFAAGEFPAAIARYKQAIEGGPPAAVGATLYYNLSLAHLQRFEYQPAKEAKSQADRLDSGLIKDYDRLWKYDKGDYAVVDIVPTAEELWSKFAGARSGVAAGARNRTLRGPAETGSGSFLPALLTRFAAFPALFVVVLLVMRKWRGSKMFTMSCVKCGTAFCRRCHLGAVAGGLCTQCHHLFVVRDGVSGPARNKKLLEVQKEDAKRDRIFRVLSLLSPGAGHLYAQKTALGLVLLLVWSAVLAAALLAGRIVPVTEASSQLAKPWGLAVAAVVLLAIYVAANRSRPEFEFVMPIRRAASTVTARRRVAS